MEAERAGCPIEHACVLLDVESSGGLNIFGTPKRPCGQPRNSPVTEQSYTAYKTRRDECDTQGVGPLQLTWAATQDLADERGGCWRPEVNVQVGLEQFAEHLRHTGSERDASSLYNTGKPGPSPYAERALALLPGWRTLTQRSSTTPTLDDGRQLRSGR